MRWKRLARFSMAVAFAAPVLACAAPESVADAEAGTWERLEAGLDVGYFPACEESEHGDARIVVVRADPSRFRLRLLAASIHDPGRAVSVRRWAEDNDLAVAINAGMYHPDRIRHVGYLAHGDHVNSKMIVESYKSALAFDPRRDGIPSFVLADLELTTIESLRDDYLTVVQNLRMVSHRRTNVWAPSEKRWSTAALGTDDEGRLLFLFSRSPYSVHDLNECLLQLPIGLARAQYLEGGPEASLFVDSADRRLEFMGSYETGFRTDDGNDTFWPVPNVLGLVRTVGDVSDP